MSFVMDSLALKKEVLNACSSFRETCNATWIPKCWQESTSRLEFNVSNMWLARKNRRGEGCFLKVCSFDAPHLQALTEPWTVLKAEDHWSQNKNSSNEVTWAICCNNWESKEDRSHVVNNLFAQKSLFFWYAPWFSSKFSVCAKAKLNKNKRLLR